MWKKLHLFRKKAFQYKNNLKIIFKFLKSNKLRKPRNFVPITWLILQGPIISGGGTRHQNRNWRQGKKGELRKPRNFIPFTWSI